MKIVVNADIGTFRLSREAANLYRAKGGLSPVDAMDDDRTNVRPAHVAELRADQRLAEVVELLGLRASGPGSQLEVVEIDDGAPWHILEVCGIEFVMVTNPARPGGAQMASSSTDSV